MLCVTRATAPRSSARSPSSPCTTSTDSARARQRVAVDRLADAAEQRLPAALSSPPTTIASGLRSLQRSASTRPTARPASLTTRVAPRSPPATQLEHSRQRQVVPGAGAGRPRAPRRGDRLQAAAVAAAAQHAVRPHLDVTDLAGEPGRAAVEPAAEHEPRADARAEIT